MRLHLRTIASITLVILMPILLSAEEHMLIVQVVDSRDRPIAGIVLSTKGEGAVGQPTDITGKTRIKLAQKTRPGSWVSLIVVKVLDGRDLVFNSPWDGRVMIPPFEDESDNFVPVVLILRIEKDRLVSGYALKDSLVTSLRSRKAKKVMKKAAGGK